MKIILLAIIFCGVPILSLSQHIKKTELDGIIKPKYEITTPPVICDYTFHDASLIYEDDGFFYAFASCVAPRNREDEKILSSYFSVAIFRSSNLKEWNFYKYAMPLELRDGEQGRYRHVGVDGVTKEYPIWAPEIIKYKGRFLLYCALRNTYNDSKIVLFESKSIQDDFVYKGIVVSSDKNDNMSYVPSKEIIDPYPIIDNNKLYLLYGSFARWYNGNHLPERKGIGVYIVPLHEDGMTWNVNPTFITDYYEGVCIVKHNKRYILFGSIGAWKNDSQRICYATSDTLCGPYVNTEGNSIADTISYNPGDLLIHAKGIFNGFGCITRPVEFKRKQYVFSNGHATNIPKIIGVSNESERYWFLFQLTWNNDKPQLKQVK